MATFGDVTAYTVRAAADLRTSQYHIMRFSAAAQTNIASHSGAASTAGPIGVLLNKPNSGQAATIGFFNESKVVAGAAITAGAWFTTNGSGRAVVAASGDMVVGRVLEAPTADVEIVRGLLFPSFRLNGPV